MQCNKILLKTKLIAVLLNTEKRLIRLTRSDNDILHYVFQLQQIYVASPGEHEKRAHCPHFWHCCIAFKAHIAVT